MVITVRPFRPGTTDDAGAKALEARASQHAHVPLAASLLRVHMQHAAEFDAKARQFDDSVVLLAVDTDAAVAGLDGDGFICGCVCMGIKEAWLQGQRRRLGYLFDLRVHEDIEGDQWWCQSQAAKGGAHCVQDYQRQALGSRLNAEAEGAARERGVDAVYLTVNASNSRARNFYRKHGYSLGSERALLFTPLLFTRGECSGDLTSLKLPGSHVRRVDAAEAARIADTVDGFSTGSNTAPSVIGRDLAMAAGLGSLFKSQPGKFIDSWVAELEGSERSIAALTLWDGDGTTTLEVERVIFTPATWRHPAMQVALLTADGAFLVCWASWLWHAPWGLLTALSGALFGLALGGGVLAAALLRFVVSRRRMRARLVAPVASGPHGVELLRGLVGHAQRVARHQGFSVAIANLDVLDPRLPAFQRRRPKPRTFFLQKWLDTETAPLVHHADDVPRFCTDCFFDPRDLS